jgi:hypothetical protein
MLPFDASYISMRTNQERNTRLCAYACECGDNRVAE